MGEFEEAGVRVYGISRDSPWSHQAWKEVLGLDSPLVSDWNAEAVRGFGIATEWRGMHDVAQRSAFLAGQDGIIRGAWRYRASEVPSFDELLAAARSLS
jgi:peroxiredoxin